LDQFFILVFTILRCSVHTWLIIEMEPSLTDEDLLDDFMTFFIAGHETTANALSFLICEVGRRPDVMQRCVRLALVDGVL